MVKSNHTFSTELEYLFKIICAQMYVKSKPKKMQPRQFAFKPCYLENRITRAT